MKKQILIKREPRGTTRRRFLQIAGLGSLALLSGCEIPFNPLRCKPMDLIWDNRNAALQSGNYNLVDETTGKTHNQKITLAGSDVFGLIWTSEFNEPIPLYDFGGTLSIYFPGVSGNEKYILLGMDLDPLSSAIFLGKEFSSKILNIGESLVLSCEVLTLKSVEKVHIRNKDYVKAVFSVNDYYGSQGDDLILYGGSSESVNVNGWPYLLHLWNGGSNTDSGSEHVTLSLLDYMVSARSNTTEEHTLVTTTGLGSRSWGGWGFTLDYYPQDTENGVVKLVDKMELSNRSTPIIPVPIIGYLVQE